jgi:hypothetical protein
VAAKSRYSESISVSNHNSSVPKNATHRRSYFMAHIIEKLFLGDTRSLGTFHGTQQTLFAVTQLLN